MRGLKEFTVLVCLVFLLAGCVVTKRGMLSEHVFYSNRSPNIQLEVDPSFKHKRGKVNEYDYQFIDTGNKRWLYVEHYITAANKTQVDYYNHPSGWIFYGIPEDSIINKGEVEILGKAWYYANTLRRAKKGCYFAKYLRRFTVDHNVFTIKYREWYPQNDCGMWQDMLTLSDNQQEFLRKFDQSFSQAATIKAYTEY